MKRRDAVDSRDDMADPDRTPTSGAIARHDDRTQHAAAVGAADADGRASRHCQGAMAYLKDLADELDARGLVARVIRTGSGVAFIRVVNPLATTMRENVTCAPSPAGLHDWYYWWSWGECMHRVDDPAGAAAKVARVLDTVGAPTG